MTDVTDGDFIAVLLAHANSVAASAAPKHQAPFYNMTQRSIQVCFGAAHEIT
ncbi:MULTISPECIES: hypothetical protein [unclassified Bradyrhizobium]|uniref:hypothetical protein n=1 Tax=unclassified Bradyrhizobium TaxID=2631580 RepID=UPI0014313330|nr:MULTISPECIES: hypothetical protein [unclassified Bradyrhizobium]